MSEKYQKFKQGYKREDGMIFWGYDKKSKNGERWVTEDYFKKTRISSIIHSRNWRKNNPEKYHLLQKIYRDANKEKIKIGKQKWYSENPDKAQKLFATRRALRKNLLHPDHDFKIESVLAQQCKKLYHRLGIKFEIDHIIPLSKGGWHYHLNLHVIPMSLNRKKHNKDNSVLPKCWDLKERCKIPID